MLRWFRQLFTENTSHAIVLRTIASNTFIYLLNFITFIIVTRILGPEERGKLVYISLISMFISALLTFGFLPTMKFALASGKEKLESIFSASLITVVCLNMIMALIVIMLWKFQCLGEIGNTLSVRHLIYFCLLLFFTNIFSLFTHLSLGSSQFDFSNSISMLRNFAVIPGMWILVVAFSLQLDGAIIAHIIAYAFGCFYVLWVWKEKVIWKWLNPFSLIKKHAAYAKNIWIASLSTSLSSRLDQYIVAMFINSKDLGLYSSAVQFADQILFLPSAADHVFFNKSAQHKDTTEKLLFFERFQSFMWWFTLITGLIYSLFAFYLIPVFLGDEFAQSSYIFIWYAAGVILWVIPKFFLKLFTSSDMINVSSRIILWNTILMFCAYPVLAYYFGIMGIAGFAIISSLFCGISCILAYKKYFGKWPTLEWNIVSLAKNMYQSLKLKT